MIETSAWRSAGWPRTSCGPGLTILGLMIGVGSVIVLIAVGTGSSAAVTNQIDALGSNVLLVSGAPVTRRAVPPQAAVAAAAQRQRRGQHRPDGG